MSCDIVTQDECRDVIYPEYCNNIGNCASSLKRISCCTSGGDGGGTTCPPGQYWRTVKECRQACTSGWVPAGGCQPACGITASLTAASAR